MNLTLNVYGQNVVITINGDKYTKKVENKEDRILLCDKVKATMSFLDNKMSNTKKQLELDKIKELFLLNTNNKKQQDKINKKKNDNVKVSEVKEIANKKANVKSKGKIVETLLGTNSVNVDDYNKIANELKELKASIKKESERSNKTNSKKRSNNE